MRKRNGVGQIHIKALLQMFAALRLCVYVAYVCTFMFKSLSSGTNIMV